jgi:hypothetical protein
MTQVVVRSITENVVPGKRLGRHVEHDPRSREHAFGVTIAPFKTVHHRRYRGPFDQGDLGSCTGNAAAGAINTSPIHNPRAKLLTEQEAIDLYELATQLDDIPGQYPPDDTGSSGLAAAKAAKQKGYISTYRHAFSIEEALSALQVGPVITGVDWYEGFDHPNGDGLVTISGQVRGGHEFEVVGFEFHHVLDESLVVCENSWGAAYGMAGRFKFTVKTWRSLLDAQGDVTILL